MRMLSYQWKKHLMILLVIRLYWSSPFLPKAQWVAASKNMQNSSLISSPKTFRHFKQQTKVLWFSTAKLRMCCAFRHSWAITRTAPLASYTRSCWDGEGTTDSVMTTSRIISTSSIQVFSFALGCSSQQANLCSRRITSYWNNSFRVFLSAFKVTTSSNSSDSLLENFSTNLNTSTALSIDSTYFSHRPYSLPNYLAHSRAECPSIGLLSSSSSMIAVLKNSLRMRCLYSLRERVRIYTWKACSLAPTSGMQGRKGSLSACMSMGMVYCANL